MAISILDSWHVKFAKPYLICEFCNSNEFDKSNPLRRQRLTSYRLLLRHVNEFHNEVDQKKFFKKLRNIVENFAREKNYSEIEITPKGNI